MAGKATFGTIMIPVTGAIRTGIARPAGMATNSTVVGVTLEVGAGAATVGLT